MKASFYKENLNPPGLLVETVHISERNDISVNEIFDDVTLRKFIINAQLSKWSYQSESEYLSSNQSLGSSYIQIKTSAPTSKLFTPNGEIILIHNNKNEISNVAFECTANNPIEAKNKFSRTITPFLDYLSFIVNVPIHLEKITTIDQKHQASYIYKNTPYEQVEFSNFDAAIDHELIPIYALYREAKNCNSHFYRFLCYFKILEGIFLSLRPNLFKQAKQSGLNIVKTKEFVPQTPFITEMYSELVGSSIHSLFKDRFQHEFRNSIAHYLLDTKVPMNVSSQEVVDVFISERGLIEPCVRVVIDCHINYLKQLCGKEI